MGMVDLCEWSSREIGEEEEVSSWFLKSVMKTESNETSRMIRDHSKRA